MTKIIIRKIKANEIGTKNLSKKYGDKLVNVRYIYNPDNKTRIKTVELIEEILEWNPEDKRTPWNKIMHLRVEYGEVYLGTLIRSSGGNWNKTDRYWELPYREVISLGLENRIIND